MPRYYFHLRDDLDVRDEVGEEFANFAHAREFALVNARSAAAEMIKRSGHVLAEHRIDIMDESGSILDMIYLSDVLSIDE